MDTNALRFPDPASSKEERYRTLQKQITALIEGEKDLIANLANIAAALHRGMGFWWTGFYLVQGAELVLGPFQGPVACTRIPYGKGVCGHAWAAKEVVIVDDVEVFPGHIACSGESRSEIVVPVMKNDEVLMVLDVDSEKKANFNAVDKEYLLRIANMIKQLI